LRVPVERSNREVIGSETKHPEEMSGAARASTNCLSLLASKTIGSLNNDTFFGFDGSDLLAIFAIAAAPGYLIAAATMDRLGRKTIQMPGFVMTATTFGAMALIPNAEHLVLRRSDDFEPFAVVRPAHHRVPEYLAAGARRGLTRARLTGRGVTLRRA
jgi:MFS family permease